MMVPGLAGASWLSSCDRLAGSCCCPPTMRMGEEEADDDEALPAVVDLGVETGVELQG
jgi:hypothetical protein